MFFGLNILHFRGIVAHVAYKSILVLVAIIDLSDADFVFLPREQKGYAGSGHVLLSVAQVCLVVSQ